MGALGLVRAGGRFVWVGMGSLGLEWAGGGSGRLMWVTASVQGFVWAGGGGGR